MKRYLSLLVLPVMFVLGTGTLLWTQEQTPVIPPPGQTPDVQQTQLLSPEQLDNLVAPIALYPDPLLGQILVASTYPLEVVEASQWLQRNKNLSGRGLMDAAQQQSWDPSVQALVAVPDALAVLNQDIRWTTDLGNAFLAQEADVMSAVQRMRARAQANGRLNSTPQQIVTTDVQGGRPVIVIEPADPQIIYVPYYDPFYIWGPPIYGYYPPLYYSGFTFGFGHGFNLSFCFGGWGGWGYWGWGPNWFGRTVYINNSFFPRYGFHHGFRAGLVGRTVWTHDPVHRLGIPYPNRQIAARFHEPSMVSRNSFQTGAGSRAVPAPYSNRFAGRNMEPGNRNQLSQPQRVQNQAQQRYQAPRYQAPAQRYQAPAQRYQAPTLRNPAPVQRYEAPAQRNQAPVQRYQAPAQRNQAPVQRYQAPVQRNQAPVQRNQAPVQRYQAPVQRYQAPVQRNQAPVQRYQAPVQRYQAPAQRYQAPVQRYQAPQIRSVPQQRYQAPQLSRSAPMMSTPRMSGGGSFNGGRVFGGGRVSGSGVARSNGGGRKR